MAPNTIILPLVPDSLDFISSLQFWSQFGDLTDVLAEKDEDKTYDMMQIVLSKVDSSSSALHIIRHWAKTTYGCLVLRFRIAPLHQWELSLSTRFLTR